MKGTIRNMHKVHHELMANRAARRQETQVPIYSIKRDGTRYAKPTLFVDYDKVDEKLAYLRTLNPGMRFEVGR